MMVVFMTYGFEFVDEFISLPDGEAEWRQQAQRMGAGASHEAMLFLYEAAAHLLVRDVKLDADHQSAAAHISDMRLRGL